MAQKLPYSDGAMSYDYENHRYVLTLDHVKNVLNVDLETRLNTHGSGNRATLAQSYLNRISREVYIWLYGHNNQLLIEYLCAKSETARRAILTALEEQLLYWLANGDVALMTGIDVRRGAYADRKVISRATIAPNAESVLVNTILPETGCSLAYTGYYNIFKALPAYESEEY